MKHLGRVGETYKDDQRSRKHVLLEKNWSNRTSLQCKERKESVLRTVQVLLPVLRLLETEHETVTLHKTGRERKTSRL